MKRTTKRTTNTTTNTTTKPVASLSLDLDNQWSYMKTHGDPGWESYPSYLDVLVPRVLGVLGGRRITFFVVGRDAARPEHHEGLRALVADGHEIGNHSFRHEPWLHLYSEGELEAEVARAEDAIGEATGVRPRGFRGPGYSLSATTLSVLVRRGYRYDASTLPTHLGPLARAYYFRTARLGPEARRERRLLFGTRADGRRPVAPYLWDVHGERLLELPVTTLPWLKVPIHVSYLLYLSTYSRAAARAYFATALQWCRLAGIGPSILLHPLDFLGRDDVEELAFFPGMRLPLEHKLACVSGYLDQLAAAFDVRPVGEHAAALARGATLRVRAPDFARESVPGGSR